MPSSLVGEVNGTTVLCIIPARSGSRRIPDKNLRTVGGTTLLERAIAVARAAFRRVVVSTDSEPYAAIAAQAGACVPGLRPPSLALDDSPVDGVIQHALEAWVPEPVEVVVLVQATSPFSTVDDLRGVVSALLEHPQAGCALTAVAAPSTTAYLLAHDSDGLHRFLAPRLTLLRTQDLPPLAVPTGAAYAARGARLRGGGALIEEPLAVILVDPARALDIDEEADLRRADEAAFEPRR
jgi:CMP-N-acetylneuraminic acid synthetase